MNLSGGLFDFTGFHRFGFDDGNAQIAIKYTLGTIGGHGWRVNQAVITGETKCGREGIRILIGNFEGFFTRNERHSCKVWGSRIYRFDFQFTDYYRNTK